MKKIGSSVLLFIAALLFAAVSPVHSASSVAIEVRTVLASNQSDHVDPNLAELAGELKSVFRYSSYTLLKHDRMRITVGKTQHTALPGGRQMTIRPIRTSGNRLEMELSILKGKRSVFQTRIELRNNSSITVGGPRYKKGYLLFNLSTSF